MGAILAVIHSPGDQAARECLARMLETSPYRGEASVMYSAGLVLGVQGRHPGEMAYQANGGLLALEGYISNWDELTPYLPEGYSPARRLFELLREKGDNLVSRLNGEFFLFYQPPGGREALVAGSRAGTRPLFWGEGSGRLLLATEPGQVLAGMGQPYRLNRAALAMHLCHGGQLIDRERTPLEGVRRLISGEIYRCSFQQRRLRRLGPYWQPPVVERLSRRAERELPEKLLEILQRVAARSVPAEPFGVALSGGFDSPTVLALFHELGVPARHMQPVSMSFPGLANDETPAIEAMLHHVGRSGTFIDATHAYLSQRLSGMAPALDFLPAAPLINTIDIVSEQARRQGLEVIVGGQGGDLIFSLALDYAADEFRRGHPVRAMRHLLSYRGSGAAGVSAFPRRFWRHVLAPRNSLLRRLRGGKRVPAWLEAGWRDEVMRVETARANMVAKVGFGQADTLLYTRALQGGYGWDLIEQRRAQLGVEERSPLIDNELLDFLFRTPPRCLEQGKSYKSLLGQAMGNRLPTEVGGKLTPTYHSDFVTQDRGLLQAVPAPPYWVSVAEGVVDLVQVRNLWQAATDRGTVSVELAYLIVCEAVVRAWQGQHPSAGNGR